MKIWHQSFIDLDVFPLYRETLKTHASNTVGAEATVVVHGLKPGTYGPMIAPMDVNRHAYLRTLNCQQVCEAALAAEAAGYDAFALGCFFDPALQEARSLVDIPVVSLAETTMLTACSLGRKFALISLTEFQKSLTEDLAHAYGMSHRLAGVVAMSPGVCLFDLEGDAAVTESIKARFADACRQAMAMDAEVIIPGDGVLNEFLVRHKVLKVDGAVVMDSLGVLFHHAIFFARACASGSLAISRRLLYAKPTPKMLAHFRQTYHMPDPDESLFSGGEYGNGAERG